MGRQKDQEDRASGSFLVTVTPIEGSHAEVLPVEGDPRDAVVGRWFWVTEQDEEEEDEKDEVGQSGAQPKRKKKRKNKSGRRLGCVMRVGSNFAEIQHPGGAFERIHDSEWAARTEPEFDPRAVIGREIGACRGRVHGLLAEIHAVTARLGVPDVSALGPRTTGAGAGAGAETSALAVRGAGGVDLHSYKRALARAKDKQLPKLFKEVERANEELATWMSAELLPLKAEQRAMQGATDAIEERIFSVELYAGLVEQLAIISNGEPAARAEPVRLFQRKHFMDEESLARYEAGGMEFSDIHAFDAWLARPQNRDRILPFPRSIAAFQVRREVKEREFANLREFFQIIESEKLDKLTFLYIRNGERIYRLSTEIDFGDRLFPDVSNPLLRGGGKLYAETHWESVGRIITADEYDAMVAEERRKEEEVSKLPEEEQFWHRDSFPESKRYEPFDQRSVNYDDIVKHIREEMKKHNRIVLVLQGLLDRSPALHPHPPWSLWTDAGFHEALRLVYDTDRALTSGDQPDFEAYRTALNSKIAPGTACVGQEDFWEQREAERYNDCLDRRFRTYRGDYRPKRYRPPGDPGPGRVARVLSVNHRRKTATFAWERERAWSSRSNDGVPVRCTIEVPFKRLLSADAYEAGDYRKFFEDPRTRADYLKWAPLLLVAEDYRAGKRQAKDAVFPKPRQHTVNGARRYRLQKRRDALVGKAVRLVRDIKMLDDRVYPKGTLFRVANHRGDKFAIAGIDADGKDKRLGSGVTQVPFISNASMDDFEVDESVPLAQKDD